MEDDAQNRVHIPVWGGLRELAQALWKVKEIRSEQELKVFSQKIQVHVIGDQDWHRDYILNEFKEVPFLSMVCLIRIFWLKVIVRIAGMHMTGDLSRQNAEGDNQLFISVACFAK